MPKWLTHPTSTAPLLLCVGMLLVLPPSLDAGIADPVPPSPPITDAHPDLRTVLATGTTVTGERIEYPSGAPARLTAVEITLQPGQQTGWHVHPVPLFGYVIEGELTVDYGAAGQRRYRKGDGLAEAMNQAHNGRNTGRGPLKILVVFIGAEEKPGTVAAPPPGH